MRRAASARRREENKAALVSDLERTRAEADARQQARRDAISASFAESAMRADQRRQAMAPVPPERPTLREQAAAARARKGTPQERAKALQAKAQRRFAYAHKQEESLGRQMDAAARTRNARLVQAEGERSRSERTRLVAEAETYGAKARDIAEKSRRYTKTKTRLMSHRDRIVRAIKSTGASLRG